MKDCIYNFVNGYITGIENGQISEISLKKILSDKNNFKLMDVRNSLLSINDDIVLETLTKLENDDVLYEYLKMLMCFVEQRKRLNYSVADVSYRAFMPELTIRRYENLQNIISSSKQIKLLKIVEIKISFSSQSIQL